MTTLGKNKKPAFGVPHQRGVSLIEILLALAIGVMLSAAMLTLFAQTVQTRNQIERTGQKTEAGRFALDQITMDLRLAGYYGDFIPGALVVGLNTPLCLAGGLPRADDLGGVTGWSPPLGGASPTVPAAIRGFSNINGAFDGCAALPNHRSGTDALVIWRAHTETKEPGKKIYFVANCNQCSPSDGIPTLKEMSMANGDAAWSGEVSLVPGVEQLRVEFGIDGDGNGTVDNFVLAPDVTNWGDVLAARVHVLVRDLAPTNGHLDNFEYVMNDPDNPIAAASDSFKRRVFSTTTALTNVMGRRER